MTYVPFPALPVNPAARALRLAHERAQGGTLYQRPDASLVLVRATWGYPPSTPSPATGSKSPETADG